MRNCINAKYPLLSTFNVRFGMDIMTSAASAATSDGTRPSSSDSNDLDNDQTCEKDLAKTNTSIASRYFINSINHHCSNLVINV